MLKLFFLRFIQLVKSFNFICIKFELISRYLIESQRHEFFNHVINESNKKTGIKFNWNSILIYNGISSRFYFQEVIYYFITALLNTFMQLFQTFSFKGSNYAAAFAHLPFQLHLYLFMRVYMNRKLRLTIFKVFTILQSYFVCI